MNVGIDVVEIARFRFVLDRSPWLEPRLFTEGERTHCRRFKDPTVHLAGTYAGKEAAIKALFLRPFLRWIRRVEVVRGGDGAPHVLVDGLPCDGSLSISHDGPVAVAIAMLNQAERHEEWLPG